MSDAAQIPALFSAIVERICRTHYWRIDQGKSPSHRKSVLTNELLEGHLLGYHKIGACPIIPGESTTCIGLLDIDDHEELMQGSIDAVASRIFEVGASRNLYGTAIKSTSGTGRHICFLWPVHAPQQAAAVRAALVDVLRACGLKPGTGGIVDGEVEVFPKQDYVSLDGFGSMFVLPLRQHLLSAGGWLLCEPLPEVPERAVHAVHVVRSDSRDLRTDDEIAEVLEYVPNSGSDSLNYDEWFRVVCGIHSATGGGDHGLAIALAWSAQSPKHSKSPEFLEQRVWPYIHADRHPRVTFASVEAMAHDAGWRPGRGPRRQSAFSEVESVPENAGDAVEATPEHVSAIRPLSTFVASLEPPEYVWDEVLQKACLYALTARWGHGKTALAISIALHVAAGRPLAGRLTAPGRVLYLCGENPADVRLRVVAALEHFGFADAEREAVSAGVWFTERPFSIDEPRALARFLGDAVKEGPFALAVVDTGPAHSSADEENDNREMHALAMALRDFMAPLGHPACIAMMHPAKGAGRDDLQPRGGGAFSGSIDGELCCWQEPVGNGGAAWVEFFHRTKFRGPGFVPLFWQLDRVQVAGLQTNFDKPVITVVAVPGGGPPPRPRGKWQCLVVDAIQVCQSLDEGASYEEILDWCLANSGAPSGRDTRPQHVRRAVDEAMTGGILCQKSGSYRFRR